MAKILVADDNSNIQKMVGLALKDQGIDVVAVGNGEAAVRKISDIHPDLVLADVFMPVRNGYEVCRYVKEDPALAHIPVILLVGAFDPLDEQEAQRVGADGVLKKPFVPPDPLISMVKSALLRAGVALGPTAAEKMNTAPKRSTAEIMSGVVSSKVAAPSPEKFPEATPEPLEELPTTMPHLKIAAGSEPLAFGSLLDTTEAEDLAITAKPMIHLSEHGKWEEESDEVAEEKEEAEEESHGGWRPGGLDEAIEHAAKASPAAPDWREEAFHGNSPAKSFPSSAWAPAIEPPALVEAAESQSVAVATLTAKPTEGPAPFTSDAWAAAMAAGVEEKIGESKDIAAVAPETEAAPEVHEPVAEQIAELAPVIQDAAVEPAPAVESSHPEQAAEPANWAAVPETAWEMEAKKASLLASTWDAPKVLSVDDTQEVPAYASEVPAEHIETSTHVTTESSAYSAEPVVAAEAEEQVQAPASELPSEPAPEASAPKSWENAWEAPALAVAPAEPAAEETHTEAAHLEIQPAPAFEAATEVAVPEPVAAAQSTEADMDELVARVLGKMNPEVLQRVTREILKPVIEAIVRDEINSKKS